MENVESPQGGRSRPDYEHEMDIQLSSQRDKLNKFALDVSIHLGC